jgi:predicted aminopeptidase
VSGTLRRRALPAFAALILGGCGAADSLDYYWQGMTGQLDLITRAKPVTEVIAQTDDARLRERLERAREIRAYASRELALPDNGSYQRYVDLGRAFVVWNVFATPELSLKAREWCFPVAGCVNYRGYFAEADAREELARLRAAGDDVYLGGVPAYSTLGWFDDPILSSFVRFPDVELARLIFHELSHQVVYVKGDTVFNESFATAVEDAGVRRWVAAQPPGPAREKMVAEIARNDRLRAEFRRLVRATRSQLTTVYASDAPDDVKRSEKAAAFAAMRAAYDRAKAGEPGLAGFERWFAGQGNAGPNNASLAAIALYTDRVPAFRALLDAEGGDLPRFYERVRELAALPKPERDGRLAALAPVGSA